MTAATVAASFLAQVGLARQLGPSGLGSYHATSLFVILIATLTAAGLPIALAERVARLDQEEHGDLDRVLATAVAITAVAAVTAALIGWALWAPFAALARLRPAADMPLIAAALGGTVLQASATGILLGQLRVGTATLLVLLQPGAVLTGLLANSAGASLDGSALAALGAAAPGAAALAILVRTTPLMRPDPRTAGVLLGRSVAASSILYPSFLSGWIDRFIILTLISTTALGAFTAASALIEAIQRLARNVGNISVPAYARLTAHSTRAGRVLDSQVRIMSTSFIVAGAVLIAAGPGFLAFLYGPSFSIAGTTLRLLAIGLLPFGLLLSLAGNAAGTDRLRRAARILLLVAPLHLGGAILGVRAFHIAGVALSDLLVWGLAVVLFAAPWSRSAVVPLWLTMRVAGVAVPTFVFAWWLGLQPLAWPAAATAAGAAALVSSTLVLLTLAEIRLVLGLLGRERIATRPTA